MSGSHAYLGGLQSGGGNGQCKGSEAECAWRVQGNSKEAVGLLPCEGGRGGRPGWELGMKSEVMC